MSKQGGVRNTEYREFSIPGGCQTVTKSNMHVYAVIDAYDVIDISDAIDARDAMHGTRSMHACMRCDRCM